MRRLDFNVRATRRELLTTMAVAGAGTLLPWGSLIGQAPGQPGLWLDYGHAHWGLTLGPVSGRLIAEMMTGATIRKYKDDTRLPVTDTYRRELTAAEFARVGRAVRVLKATQRQWHLIFYNCNDFAIEIAEALGLRRPPSLMPPGAWVRTMRALNER